MKSICFVANFYKTYLFHALAKKLEKEGITVTWVVTKQEQYKFLSEHYAPGQILYINRSFSKKTAEPVDDFRLNELVYGDRVFKHDLGLGLNFLTNIQKPIYEFLKAHQTRFVIGEITWAHELLLRRMTIKRKELDCLYLECSLVRIPNYRLAFFTDEFQNGMLEFNLPVKTDKIIALEKPAYLKINDKIVKKQGSVGAKIKRIKRFLSGENIEKNDPNVITNKLTRIKVMGGEELNRIMYKQLETVSFDSLKNQNFVFVGFHKQPEASIDVSGRYYEDQALNIINLWRLLPQGWKLVMKEHTNAIGDRSYAFYKRLLKFPGIVLVNEKTDSKLLIENCKLVATVTGTIAYEAALLKVPAITFSPVFFNRINYCRYMPLHQLVNYDSITSLVDEIKSAADNRIEYSNYLLQNTFEGYISDQVTDPTVMNDENIERLKEIFLVLFAKFGRA